MICLLIFQPSFWTVFFLQERARATARPRGDLILGDVTCDFSSLILDSERGDCIIQSYFV
jgi:hypothetical protein